MKHLGRAFFAFLTLLVIFLWWKTPWIVTKLEGGGRAAVDLGTFGDIYGTTNALFSGLAFLGLIYTIYLQRLDLKQNMEELRLSRQEVTATNDALKEQTHQMQIAGRLGTLPVLMGIYKARLVALAPKLFTSVESLELPQENLKQYIRLFESKDLEDAAAGVENHLKTAGSLSCGFASVPARAFVDTYTHRKELIVSLRGMVSCLDELEEIFASSDRASFRKTLPNDRCWKEVESLPEGPSEQS